MTRTRTFLLVLLTAMPASVFASESWETCNEAPVKALGFITVGKAALSKPACDAAGDTLLAPPLHLEFAYTRAVPGDAFAKAAMVMIERNIDAQRFNDIAERLRAFNSGYRDIDDGDRYRLVYLPSGELQLWLNDEQLAVEQGHDFAEAYLSIWFGQKPYSDAMKETLLGQR